MVDERKTNDKPTTDKPEPTIPVGGGVPGAGGSVATSGGQVPVGAGGGIDLSGAGGAAGPVGGMTLDVGADVTKQLSEGVPAFGNVLASIGLGVAQSQKSLDDGVIDTVNRLKDLEIEIITDVIEVLDDGGIPDPAQTEIRTEKVSVLNFFTPTFHEWKNVSLAMDLEVGAFHLDQGIQFTRSQRTLNTTATGLFWGFLGWFDTKDESRFSSATSSVNQETRWQQGQVRVDAQLGPRRTSKLGNPDKIEIGPQIYVTQGAVAEEKTGTLVTARTIDIEIRVRKANGDANPGKSIVFDAGGLLPSFPGGNVTDPDGVMTATLKRAIFPGFGSFQRFSIGVRLGDIRRTFNVTL